MPDISMCTNYGCVDRHRCYRATATADRYRQTYFMPLANKAEDCKSFWPNEAHEPMPERRTDPAADEGRG